MLFVLYLFLGLAAACFGASIVLTWQKNFSLKRAGIVLAAGWVFFFIYVILRAVTS